MDRTIGPWDCSTIFLDLSINYQWGREGGGMVLVLLINGVLTGSHITQAV